MESDGIGWNRMESDAQMVLIVQQPVGQLLQPIYLPKRLYK